VAEASPAELARDVELAKAAGLDLLRVHAHVTRPELYDAADEAGVLVWQDMPLQWAYARGVRKEAVRQARELVDLLGHHPSIAIWCGHNEPFRLDTEPGSVPDPAALVTSFGAAQDLPGTDEFIEPQRWPDLDWDRLAPTTCLQKPLFDRYVPPAEHATFESWRDATQAYQATVVKHHVETLRRLKYRPTGGFAHFF